MNRETLQKIINGQATIGDLSPELIYVRTEGEPPIDPNTPLSENLIRFLIEHAGDCLPGPMVCVKNGALDLL